jgi:hypothetical protein
MKKRDPKLTTESGAKNSSIRSHSIRMSEARAQVISQEADAIKEGWADGAADRELLVKLAEARSARETSTVFLAVDTASVRQKVLTELLRKASLETPVRPPKHARFAVFLLPRCYQHIIFGDLEELYPQWVEECGPSKAAFLYWWQFILSTLAIAWPKTRGLRYLAIVTCMLGRVLMDKDYYSFLHELFRHLQ